MKVIIFFLRLAAYFQWYCERMSFKIQLAFGTKKNFEHLEKNALKKSTKLNKY